MKTALEYFIEQLDCLNIERKKNLIDAETFFKHKKILTQQAKAMEKEQIMSAFMQGDIFGADYYDGVNPTDENYYKQTFKSE